MAEKMWDQTCRTCLATCGELVPIFSNDYYVRNLPDKLFHTTRIEVRKMCFIRILLIKIRSLPTVLVIFQLFRGIYLWLRFYFRGVSDFFVAKSEFGAMVGVAITVVSSCLAMLFRACLVPCAL